MYSYVCINSILSRMPSIRAFDIRTSAVHKCGSILLCILLSFSARLPAFVYSAIACSLQFNSRPVLAALTVSNVTYQYCQRNIIFCVLEQFFGGARLFGCRTIIWLHLQVFILSQFISFWIHLRAVINNYFFCSSNCRLHDQHSGHCMHKLKFIFSYELCPDEHIFPVWGL